MADDSMEKLAITTLAGVGTTRAQLLAMELQRGLGRQRRTPEADERPPLSTEAAIGHTGDEDLYESRTGDQ